MRFTRNFLLQSMHVDWYICQSKMKNLHTTTDVMLDFYNGEPDVLQRCTFLFHPIAQTENKLRMCKNVVGPVKNPIISGQPLPHPPHLVLPAPQPYPALPSCIPVCPAGTVGGAPGLPTSVGPSSPIPSLPGILAKSRYFFIISVITLYLYI